MTRGGQPSDLRVDDALPWPIARGDTVVGCFRYRATGATRVETWPREADYRLPDHPDNVIAFAIGDLVWRAQSPFFVFVGDDVTEEYFNSRGRVEIGPYDRLDVYYRGRESPASSPVPGLPAGRHTIGITFGDARVRRVFAGPAFLDSLEVPNALEDFDFGALSGGDGAISFHSDDSSFFRSVLFLLDIESLTVNGEAVTAETDEAAAAVRAQSAAAWRLCAPDVAILSHRARQ